MKGRKERLEEERSASNRKRFILREGNFYPGAGFCLFVSFFFLFLVFFKSAEDPG